MTTHLDGRAAPGSSEAASTVTNDRLLILQRFLAALYFLSGTLKPFPDFIAEGVPDNIPVMLKTIAKNNANTLLEGPSLWFADHPWLIIVFLGTAMAALGIVYWQDNELVRVAAVGNIIMLLCLIAFVHRTWIQIIPADSAMIVAAALIYHRQGRKRRGERRPEVVLADAA